MYIYIKYSAYFLCQVFNEIQNSYRILIINIFAEVKSSFKQKISFAKKDGDCFHFKMCNTIFL